MHLVTADEMRRLDRATIARGHATGAQLMERAGAGVAVAMAARYGAPLALRVLVLCGTGNNGGDGFVAARHLRARGADVTVGLLGARDKVKGDALVQLEAMEAEGVQARALADEPALRALAGARTWDFALDAVLGTGARGAPEALAAAAVQVLRELDDQGTRVVAVDIPTGVGADTGAIARRAVRADLTVTFGAPKRGHLLYPGRAFTGVLEVVDIGLLDDDGDPRGLPVRLATAADMADLVPERDPRAHKNAVGRVLVVGGSAGLTGAPALAARAATRAGAGYVQLAVPASLANLFAIKLTEQMAHGVPETAARTLGPPAFEAIAALARGADVVVLGSGMSRDAAAAALARRLALELDVPVVIDADGLNAFEGDAAALAGAHGPRVLTPHLGEMSRLTGEAGEALEAARIDAARARAIAWRAVVALKGAPTVTASPEGEVMVNPTGNAGLATAGTGDVLAGAIAALMGQGLGPWRAACLGVYAHGMAGDIAAEARGMLGLAASDVVEALPEALKRLGRVRDEQLERRGRERRR
jgi:ADP-dependent NAD(P)H-hydrate dehydratase / NAD(P)H-hydrate epimerase